MELYSIGCNGLYGEKNIQRVDICIYIVDLLYVHLKRTQPCKSITHQ